MEDFFWMHTCTTLYAPDGVACGWTLLACAQDREAYCSSACSVKRSKPCPCMAGAWLACNMPAAMLCRSDFLANGTVSGLRACRAVPGGILDAKEDHETRVQAKWLFMQTFMAYVYRLARLLAYYSNNPRLFVLRSPSSSLWQHTRRRCTRGVQQAGFGN